MKMPLLIIGAGNVGGFLSYNIDEFGAEYDVLGFLDDNPAKVGTTMYGRQVLGRVSDIQKYAGQQLAVVIGIANPVIKRKIAEQLSNYDFEFPSFISRNVWLSKQVSVGKGVILYPGVSINYETTLGDFVIMNMNCAIGHNCTINDYATLAPGVNLAGFSDIGECADIGIGVSTKQQIQIGEKATVGGQTMLVKNVPAGALVFGVPGTEKRTN